jgi:predicted PurR-regulated permease PerM
MRPWNRRRKRPPEPALEQVVVAALPPPPPVVVNLRLSPIVWLAVATLVLFWLARAIIGPFVVAAVIAYAVSPIVGTFERRTSLPRVVVVLVGYVVTLSVLGVLMYFLAGRISHELGALASSGPDALASRLREVVGSDTIDIAGQHVSVASIAHQIQDRFGGLFASPDSALQLAGRVGEIGLEAILVLILTFYFLVDGARFRDWTIALLPSRHRPRTVALIDRVHAILGRWLEGQIFLVGLVAVVVYIALGPILHLPYALAIAVLTGILEVIPLVGPLIATAIAGTDAFVQGGVGLAVTVVVIYFILRQVEDQVVAPIVIGRAVHLHPIVTIFAVFVGLSTWGILGGLLGVPVAAAINVIFRELYPTGPPPAPPEAVPD